MEETMKTSLKRVIQIVEPQAVVDGAIFVMGGYLKAI
jgi:hypothetical protein